MALGLILSSSDMFYVTDASQAPASDFVAGATGSAVLNSSLSSPLTSSGDFCRGYTNKAGAVNSAFVESTILSSIDSGLYVGPFSTSKAYSMRAWIRTGIEANTKDGVIGLVMRTNSGSAGLRAYTTGGNLERIKPGGYLMQLSGQKTDTTLPGDEGGPFLSLGANAGGDGASDPQGTPNPSFPSVVCSGTYVKDTWYRVRFDCIPVGTSGDTLSVYTSSAGDVATGQETWELVGTTFISATDAVYYEPSTTTASMGWFAYHNGTGGNAVGVNIDQFEILVEDL